MHFVELSKTRIDLLEGTLLFSIFFSFCKVRFQCCRPQLNRNQIVLVLKGLEMTYFSIMETLVYMRFALSPKSWIDLLERWLFFHNFCGLRKVRFRCYSPQLKVIRSFLCSNDLDDFFWLLAWFICTSSNRRNR